MVQSSPSLTVANRVNSPHCVGVSTGRLMATRRMKTVLRNIGQILLNFVTWQYPAQTNDTSASYGAILG